MRMRVAKCSVGTGSINWTRRFTTRRAGWASEAVMKKLALGFLALMFLVPLVPAASAQVVVAVGNDHHHHRHCWYSHHHRHCR